MSRHDMHDSQKYYESNEGMMSYEQMDERTRSQLDAHMREQMGLQLEEQMKEHAHVQESVTGNSIYGGEEEGEKYIYADHPYHISGNVNVPNTVRNPTIDQQQGNTVEHINLENNNVNEHKVDERTVAAPTFPRQVMTALGPLPLPEEFRKNIPEKFVAKPIIEEREIYVSKKERKQREVEVPHVQYEHTFKNIKKQFRVSKLIPTVADVIKEVPKEILKPVIEEKIIEVPQGVKYVEVPVEVPCLYPPKIVPRVVTQYVERIVETVKPIVQEKIIEVPQTVIKQVPKIKTVEVPYYIPRYVEKIVEVPFRPNGEMPPIGSHLPFSISKTLPPLKPTHLLKNPSHMNMGGPDARQQNRFPDSSQFNEMNKFMFNSNQPHVNMFSNPTAPGMFQQGNIGRQMAPPLSNDGLEINAHRNSINEMHNFNMTMPVNSNMNYGSNMVGSNIMFNSNQVSGRENLLSQVEGLQHRYNLPDGMQWGYPDGVTRPHVKLNQVPPVVVTCPPEIGKVTCARKDIQPDILTKTGVHEFDGFKKKGTAQALFPPLAQHNRVPFLPHPAVPGTPDIQAMQQTK